MCSIGNALYEDLSVQQFTDCYFEFSGNDEKKIFLAAHKNVLASATRVFKEMFYGPEKQKSPIAVKDVPFETFRRFVGCIYDQDIHLENCTEEEVRDLYYAGKKYDFPKAVELARSAMAKTISLDTVETFYEIADLFEDDDLKEKCYDVMNPVIFDDIQANEYAFPKASKETQLNVKPVLEGSELSIALKNYKLFMEEESKLLNRAGKFVGLVEFLSTELKKLIKAGIPIDFEKNEDDSKSIDMEMDSEEEEETLEKVEASPPKRKSLDVCEGSKNKVIKSSNSFEDKPPPAVVTLTLKANPEKKFIKPYGMIPLMLPLKKDSKNDGPPKLEPIKHSFSQLETIADPIVPKTNISYSQPTVSVERDAGQQKTVTDLKKICLKLFFVHRDAFQKGDHSIWRRDGSVMRKYMPTYIGKELQYRPTKDYCAWEDWKSAGEVSGVNVCFKSDDIDSNVTIVKMKNHDANQSKSQ